MSVADGFVGLPMLAASAAMAVLAVELLWRNPWGRAAALLSAFLMARSVQNAYYGLMIASADVRFTAAKWEITPYAVILVTFLALAFVSQFPTRRKWLAGRWGPAILIAGAGTAIASYIVDPAGSWGTSSPVDGAPTTKGPLYAFAGLYVLAYAVVALVLAAEARRTSDSGSASGLAVMSLSFALFPAYAGTTDLLGIVFEGVGLAAVNPTVGGEWFVVRRVLRALALVPVAILALWLWRRPSPAGADIASRSGKLLLMLAPATGIAVSLLGLGDLASAVRTDAVIDGLWTFAQPALLYAGWRAWPFAFDGRPVPPTPAPGLVRGEPAPVE